MDVFRQWAFALCLAAVAGGVCQIMVPQSSLERVFKITASAFFICCMAYPLTQTGRPLLDGIPQVASNEIQAVTKDLESAMALQTAQKTKDVFDRLARKKLDEMGIKDPEVSIYIRTDGESVTAGDISVEILMDSVYEGNHQEMADALVAELGVDVRIGYRR